MDQPTIGYLSYRRHRICNPYSFEQLGRTLDFADLKPGDKAADLGCGNGVVSAWMTARHGLDLTAVERYPAVAELAREAAAAPRPQGRMQVVEGAAGDYLARAGEHRLLCALGAVDLLAGLHRPGETMAALAPHIAPGGWLLWGDPFWRTPPTERLAAVFGAERYASLAGWVAAGEAAGLSVRHVAVSADADWEEFFWRMNASLEDWAEENAGTPDAAAIRFRAAVTRTLFLEEGREAMGFGLYLFRKVG